jgi:hypothetical protein
MFRAARAGTEISGDWLWEVTDVRRYLLVLDMDLLALDEELDLEPINYLIARQDEEPCEVMVVSLTDRGQAKLPSMELLLGAQVGKFPVAPQPDHDVSAAAEHRMNLAVRHLKAIGCQASGVISDEELDPLHQLRRRWGKRLVLFSVAKQAG